MLRSKREQFLLFFVVLAVLVLGSTILYRQMGDTLFGMDSLLQDKITEIENVLSIQEKAVEINSRHEDMKREIALEGSNPEQDAAIRKILTDILNEVGLTNKYGGISPKEQRMEEEFKVAAISINQIQCTPQQLGQLLFRIEKQSKVMDVEICRITNLISEIGKPTIGRSRGAEVTISPSGLLEVDLEITRLIQYRDGEKPKKRTRT